MQDNAVVFVSCGIFEEELRHLVQEKKLDWNIVQLDPVLHVNYDRLKEKLVEALEANRGPGVELKVIYGQCHPEMMEILKRYGAKKLRAGNCLDAMIGAERMRWIDEEGKAFFLSAGWVNNWERMFALGEADFGLDFKSLFSSYKRVIILDTGVIPIDEEKVGKFSEFTGLPVERMPITLDYLLRLIESI